MSRIRLIHWKEEQAVERLAQLAALGFHAEYAPLNAEELRAMRADPPQAIIIDLTRSPSQGRDLGINLRKYKDTRYAPLIFVGGDRDKVDRVRELLPDAMFTDWEGIDTTLNEALSAPLSDPVVPDSAFAAYAGTPLPKKLGIKTGSRVYLIDAPEGFEVTLGALPEGVILIKGDGVGDVHLWFARACSDLEANIERMGELAASGPLWIIWPKKSSRLASDLTQPIVRKAGLDSGLVDYKVCSVDDTWTGLCFTRRKAP
jgi:hypothetical protein